MGIGCKTNGKVSYTLLDLILTEKRRRADRNQLARILEDILLNAMKDPASPWSMKDALADLLAICDASDIVGPAVDKARVILAEAERRARDLT